MIEIKLDKSLFVQIGNFLFLLFLLNKFLYRPIIEVVKRREDSIKRMENDVRILERRLKDLELEYEKKEYDINREGEKLYNALRNEGEAIYAKVLEKVKEEILSYEKKFKEEMNIEIETVKKAVRDKVGEFAEKIVERILEV